MITRNQNTLSTCLVRLNKIQLAISKETPNHLKKYEIIMLRINLQRISIWSKIKTYTYTSLTTSTALLRFNFIFISTNRWNHCQFREKWSKQTDSYTRIDPIKSRKLWRVWNDQNWLIKKVRLNNPNWGNEALWRSQLFLGFSIKGFWLNDW